MVAKVKWGFIVGGNDGVEEVFGVGEIGGFEKGLDLGLGRVMGWTLCEEMRGIHTPRKSYSE